MKKRDHLTVDELAPGARVNFGLIHNDYFMPVGPSAEALHPVSGVFEVPETDSHSVKGRFPAFAVAFFSHDGYLVPTERDILWGGSSLWSSSFRQVGYGPSPATKAGRAHPFLSP